MLRLKKILGYLVNPDFAAYAKSCGGVGIRVSQADALAPAMLQLFEQDGPGLLEVKTDVKLL